jgi:hypothetical protein
MKMQKRSGESGMASKAVLIVIGVVLVLGLGIVLIAAGIGAYVYYNQKPEQPKTIQPAATPKT